MQTVLLHLPEVFSLTFYIEFLIKNLIYYVTCQQYSFVIVLFSETPGIGIIATVQVCNYSQKPRIIKNPTTANLKRGTGGRGSFNGVVCTVFGGNGFIGKHIINRLGKIGTQVWSALL